jgi:rhodanese-related sulfurtransferase
LATGSPITPWLVGWSPAGAPVVIVRNPDQDPADVLWPALNIGLDTIAGQLAGGMPAWIAAGRPVATTGLVGPAQLDAPVLDVRQASEYAAGHLPGAAHVELGDLARRAADVPAGPVVVMCGHGERALTAATLLERAGHTDPRVLLGGPRDWAAATGQALAQGM